MWNVVESDGGLALGSLVYQTIWPAGAEVEASCRRPFALLPWSRMPLHGPPNVECCCGIYAVSRLELAVPYLTSRLEHGGHGIHRIIGRVRLWGRVVEAAWGWRAAFGYPEELFVPRRARLDLRAPFRPSPMTIARELDAYGVPVEVVADVRTCRAGLRPTFA